MRARTHASKQAVTCVCARTGRRTNRTALQKIATDNLIIINFVPLAVGASGGGGAVVVVIVVVVVVVLRTKLYDGAGKHLHTTCMHACMHAERLTD